MSCCTDRLRKRKSALRVRKMRRGRNDLGMKLHVGGFLHTSWADPPRNSRPVTSSCSAMPIYECDPWRMQYFTEVDCPPTSTFPPTTPTATTSIPGIAGFTTNCWSPDPRGSHAACTTRRRLRYPGLLQAGDQSQRHGRGQLRIAGRARLSGELQTGRFLDEADERRAHQHRLGGRPGRDGVVPAHAGNPGRRRVRSTIG